MSNNFEIHLKNQERIFKALGRVYKRKSNLKRHNYKNSLKYIFGCNTVYHIYARYNLIHTLCDEADTNEYCKLEKNDFMYIYRVFRSKNLASEIMENKNLGFCSYCCCSEAQELDHYLPQEYYPSFSIVYNNLVPACSTCNKIKSKNINEQFLHCDYDIVQRNIYLDVNIENYLIKFFIDKDRLSHSSDEKYYVLEKMDYTYSKLKIYKKFSCKAHQEMTIVLPQYEKILKNYGIDKAKNFIADKKQAVMKSSPEIWRRSLYQFLLKDEKFLLKGYKLYLEKYRIRSLY